MKRKTIILSIQVGYMLNPELKVHKSLKEQVESNLEKTLSSTTIKFIRKLSSKENTSVLSLLMFYENRKNTIFMVLSPVVY